MEVGGFRRLDVKKLHSGTSRKEFYIGAETGRRLSVYQLQPIQIHSRCRCDLHTNEKNTGSVFVYLYTYTVISNMYV